MKSYEKTGESNKQQGHLGFHLVLQLLNQAAQHALQPVFQFVQDSFNNRVQEVKKLTHSSPPCTPDTGNGCLEGCEVRDADIDDAPSVNSASGRRCRNRGHEVETNVNESSPLNDCRKGPRKGPRPKCHFHRGTHISRGRGAKSPKVLLLLCVMLSMVEGCTAAGSDIPAPRSIPQLYIMTVVAIFTCIWFGMRRAAVRQADDNETRKTVFYHLKRRMSKSTRPVDESEQHTQPAPVNDEPSPIERMPSRPIVCAAEKAGAKDTSKLVFCHLTHNDLHSQPTPRHDQPSFIQLIPGSHTVCVLASEETAISATAATATVVPDGTSNSYLANIGFETLDFLSQQQWLEPFHPYTSAVMAVSDPVPENGSRNPQHLQKLSMLVVGGRGSSPDPRSISTKSRQASNLSFSRTVSFPYEGSDYHSFNAAAFSAPSDDIMKDNSVLPSRNRRGQVENWWANEEECVCRPFVESASDSEDDGII